jgi:hypothetical protein
MTAFLLMLAAVPGALNPAVTQATIGQTICVRGWSASVRPPWAYTNAIKLRLVTARHGRMSDYELDHAVALEVGGATRDPSNLWIQRHKGKYGSYAKDRLENKLHALVCDGTITLDEARREIWPHWIHYYHLRVQK